MVIQNEGPIWGGPTFKMVTTDGDEGSRCGW